MMEFQTYKSKVWSPVGMPAYRAVVHERVIGDYHPVGWQVQAWVAGWTRASIDCSFEFWKYECQVVEGSCMYFNVKRTASGFTVQFPYDEEDMEKLKQLCRTAWWVPEARHWTVDGSELEQLKFLCRRSW